MKRLLLLTALLSGTAFAQNATSGSPRVQGVPAGYGDPVQVTIRNTDGSAPGAMGSVTVSSSALPTGAATSAAQTTAATTLSTIATNTTSIATAANQSSELTLVGAVTETAPATDTASSGLNGRQQRIAQRLTTINTTLGTPFQAGGALAANQSVNVAQINAVTPLMGNGLTGTGSLRVTLASDTTSNTNPLLVNQSQVNGVAVATGNGVVSTGVQRVAIASDNTAFSVTGNIAAGSAESGSLLGMGARVYNTASPPSLSVDTRANVYVTAGGNMLTQLGGNFVGVDSLSGAGILGAGAGATAVAYGVSTQVWDGTTFRAQRGDANGTVTQAGLSSTSWTYANGATGILSNTTTAVTIKTAAGVGVRNFIDSCQINTTAFTVAGPLAIRDGAGGTVIWALQVPTSGFLNPISISFTTPLRSTANTLLEVVTTTANTVGTAWVNCQGHTGT